MEARDSVNNQLLNNHKHGFLVSGRFLISPQHFRKFRPQSLKSLLLLETRWISPALAWTLSYGGLGRLGSAPQVSLHQFLSVPGEERSVEDVWVPDSSSAGRRTGREGNWEGPESEGGADYVQAEAQPGQRRDRNEKEPPSAGKRADWAGSPGAGVLAPRPCPHRQLHAQHSENGDHKPRDPVLWQEMTPSRASKYVRRGASHAHPGETRGKSQDDGKRSQTVEEVERHHLLIQKMERGRVLRSASAPWSRSAALPSRNKSSLKRQRFA